VKGGHLNGKEEERRKEEEERGRRFCDFQILNRKPEKKAVFLFSSGS
jgi:hypothetical protein